MPIVDIEYLESASGAAPGATTPQRLADALGDLFGSAPGTTWIRLRALPRTTYAENRCTLDEALAPVWVQILKARLPAPEALDEEAQRIAEIVASILERPREHVHVLYLPPGAGRVAFGGTLVRGD